ncbi:MAG: hypothetical protein EXS16_07875 [Gemmataceae bacterium]|nr:hypothetical protein [Gemmataceae bacterium]
MAKSIQTGAKNGHKKSSSPTVAPTPKAWHGHLNAYPDKQRLVFSDENELEKAIDLLWTDELRHLPHDSPDGRSLVIPADAVACFTLAGLKFTSRKLRSVADFSAEEIARLRR